jgi:hypothetical protein
MHDLLAFDFRAKLKFCFFGPNGRFLSQRAIGATPP